MNMLHALLENAAAAGRAVRDFGLISVGAAPVSAQGSTSLPSVNEVLAQGDFLDHLEEIGMLAPGGAIPSPGSPFLGDQVGLRWPAVRCQALPGDAVNWTDDDDLHDPAN